MADLSISRSRAKKPAAPNRAGSARNAAEALNEAADRLSGAGQEAVSAVNDLVRFNPLVAAGIALGVGYVFGQAYRRGHR